MKKFKDLIKEIKTNKKKGLVEKQKGLSFDFDQPFDKKKLEEANLINKINEIIKFRDPILETMEYKEWVGILQNKLVEELDPVHAKMLYEQDMFRAEKVQASRVGRSSAGGGVRKRKVAAAVDPWTPEDLMVNPEDTWIQASDAAATGDGNRIASLTPTHGNRGALTQGNGVYQPYYFASTAELNGEPSIGFVNPSGGHYGRLLGTSNYIFDPRVDEFFIAFVSAPTGSSYSGDRTVSSINDTRSVYIVLKDREDQAILAVAGSGTSAGTFSYPNAGTTAPRRIMGFGGGGAAVTFVEPTTGISQSITPGSYAPLDTPNNIISVEFNYIAEMIFITGRIPSADERTALNDYWLNKYG